MITLSSVSKWPFASAHFISWSHTIPWRHTILWRHTIPWCHTISWRHTISWCDTVPWHHTIPWRHTISWRHTIPWHNPWRPISWSLYTISWHISSHFLMTSHNHMLTWSASLKSIVLMASEAFFNKLHPSWKISKSCVSLNDDAIFLCLVSERLVSACGPEKTYCQAYAAKTRLFFSSSYQKNDWRAGSTNPSCGEGCRLQSVWNCLVPNGETIGPDKIKMLSQIWNHWFRTYSKVTVKILCHFGEKMLLFKRVDIRLWGLVGRKVEIQPGLHAIILVYSMLSLYLSFSCVIKLVRLQA